VRAREREDEGRRETTKRDARNLDDREEQTRTATSRANLKRNLNYYVNDKGEPNFGQNFEPSFDERT
jgi:hypothetical protein